MRKLIALVLLAAVLAPTSALADGGSPTTLGLTEIEPGWYSGMPVVIRQDTLVFTDAKSKGAITKTGEMTTGLIAVLKPNYIYNRYFNKWVAYAPLLRVNGRIPVVPTGNGFDYWRGIGWIEENRVIPAKTYQGEFDRPSLEPSLHTCKAPG